MKILKIESGQGFYFKDTDDSWAPIDKIDKDGLMALLNLFIANEIEVDEYDESQLKNKAQQIIYKSISSKFEDLGDNKKRFTDEVETLYLEAIRKYKD